MSLQAFPNRRWDQEVEDVVQHGSAAPGRWVFVHLCLIALPVPMIVAIATAADEITPALVIMLTALAAVAAAAIAAMVLRIRRGDFRRRDHAAVAYSAGAELSGEDESRRQAMERLRSRK